MKKISRVLVLPAALIVANASASCPIFANKPSQFIGANLSTIGMSAVADKMFAKNEHFNKAAMGTMGYSLDRAKLTPQGAAQFMAANLIIRKGSDIIGLDGLRDAAVKKCDVLPEMARDMIKVSAEVATHPNTLTVIAMEHVIPYVVGMLGGGAAK